MQFKCSDFAALSSLAVITMVRGPSNKSNRFDDTATKIAVVV